MLPDHIKISLQPNQDIQTFLATKNYSQHIVLTDENTKALCYPIVKEAIGKHTLIEIMSGEENKDLDTCAFIWQKLTDTKADRHSVLIIIGGGVLGDMGGFCAATYKRGIDFILIPTTLLAQADASIGGKLGVDFNHYKNHIGVFKEPVYTLLYSGFLKTLPEQELKSGFAEVIKHALISDAVLWNQIKTKGLHEQAWDELLTHSAAFKYSVIRQDPTEKNIRKILNAGHTIGHAIESYLLANNRKVMHGEAVAAGLIAEAYISMKRKLISEMQLQDISNYIRKVFGKIAIKENELEKIAAFTQQDKKNKSNEILAVLLEEEGRAGWDYALTQHEVIAALAYYLKD